jgi:hypothetical protein
MSHEDSESVADSHHIFLNFFLPISHVVFLWYSYQVTKKKNFSIKVSCWKNKAVSNVKNYKK